MDKRHILLVDDDEMTYRLLSAAIGKDYQVEYRGSGEAALSDIQQLDTKIVLLDIQMGDGLDGYETCRLLRERLSSSELYIIFLSGLEKLEEIAEAYGAGGDDYIVKPFSADMLLQKLKLAQDRINNMSQMRDELDQARAITMNVMGVSSDLGQVIHFLTACNQLASFSEVAKQIALILDGWGLKVTVQVRSDFELINFSLSGPVHPLEEKLIGAAREGGRIVDVAERTFFNFNCVSVFIKNMPVDNPEKYGNFKDNVAILIDGANGRVETLKTLVKLAHQHEIISKVINELSTALTNFESQNSENKDHFYNVFELLSIHIEDSFSFFDLSENQEGNLRAMLNDIRSSYDKSSQSEEILQQAVLKLKHIVTSQEFDKSVQINP